MPEVGKRDEVQSGCDGFDAGTLICAEDGAGGDGVCVWMLHKDVCKQWEDRDGFVIKGDLWRKLGHAAIDSVEGTDNHWVRSCGFEEAWKDVPLREGARL